ncbi:ankyrin repeat domain-containing protein [Aspergillus fischeri NRRL 181]|uniref:Ankyrin repeat protein n=1 Tax=Neosartorya fischeri (strain ATCC 1020 / DSM 3700 / CBS 544.65 / FGSC A1164 / JCM 1740 / NRRL 181 / WB 181) TaxID=331117 RepID=A1CYC3_NEOFI|nr:Ankyrin repeat protein [Aspergillus fischeri NRRL 181]EAW23743.1 Ankyrin repeat protein [Aspergillus fischeri NRRL 181]
MDPFCRAFGSDCRWYHRLKCLSSYQSGFQLAFQRVEKNTALAGPPLGREYQALQLDAIPIWVGLDGPVEDVVVDVDDEAGPFTHFRRVWKRLKWEPDDVRDLRSRLCSNIGLLNAINVRINRDGILELLEHKNNEQDQKCLDWLSPANYAIPQSDYIDRRQPGTGDWLLESPAFQPWIERPQETLFCPGIPGAGKTILASVVVDKLESEFGNDRDVGIAYIFCSFEHRDDQMQNPDSLLASFLRQLGQNLDPIPDSIVALYDKHKVKGTRPSFNETSKALRLVVRRLPRVFIVIDALDECRRLAISRVLDELFNLQAAHNLNLLATSRFIPEMTAKFQGKPTEEIRAAKADVMIYLNANMNKLHAFVSRNRQLQQKIIVEISDAAGGMFLLAQLCMNSLSGKLSERAIRRELEELAKGSGTYDSAYDKAMQRINHQVPEGRDMAIKVLSWVTRARRPLTGLELLHALAVEQGETEFHKDNLPDLDDVISVCEGLVKVTTDPMGDTIRLVHYTTKEYFDRRWTSWFSDADASIAATCLTYLSFNVFQTGLCLTNTELESWLDQNPLYSYADRNWGNHAQAQPIDEHLLMAFLGDTGKVTASVQEIFAVNGFSSSAAFAGHADVVKLFLEHGVDPHIRDWEGRTPISLASSGGWVNVVKQLLDHDVDPNSRDIDDQSPLSWAAYRGHTDAAHLLVKRGADPDSKDGYDKTPLSWAAAEGWLEIVQFLVEEAVKIDSRDELGRTPISWAAENGHAAVVKLLLEKGAQPPWEHAKGSGAHFASSNFGPHIAERLSGGIWKTDTTLGALIFAPNHLANDVSTDLIRRQSTVEGCMG